MRFCSGMACCNPYREQVGLSCGYGWQVTCGLNELKRLALHAPGSVPRFIVTLLAAFPVSAGDIASTAHVAGISEPFVSAAALHCAALSTKTERRAFREQIAGYLSADHLAHFDNVMAAEWSRLRSGNQRESK